MRSIAQVLMTVSQALALFLHDRIQATCILAYKLRPTNLLGEIA